MKFRKLASIYSLFMGISMISIWIMFYFTDEIPELQTKPIELGMHVAAEILTALLLIIGAIGLLTNKKWSLNIHLISIGMLIYTLIMSPGYFLQRGDIAFVLMFTLFLILAVTLTILLLIKESES